MKLRSIAWLNRVAILCALIMCSSCTTHQGYQGAGVGTLTGATAGALLDSGNPWRGAVIGGGLGAIVGGALTDVPQYPTPYAPAYYGQPYNSYPAYHPEPGAPTTPNQTGQGAIIGGLTGATAGALLDNSNPWRGSLIGGALGLFFGHGIETINSKTVNSGAAIPVLRP